MKITVNTKELENTINQALIKYKKDYVGLLALYEKKIVAYSEYIKRQNKKLSEGKTIETIKSPPYAPNSHEAKTIEKHLNGIKLHTLEEIELTSNELDEITSGIERLHGDIEETTMSLNALSY